jgi:ribosome biogenesis SPOUT family RNA methylase Rps3
VGLDKKLIIAGIAVSGAVAVSYLINKALHALDNIDFNDPFEVDFDDE